MVLDKKKLIDLDKCVVDALNLFSKTRLPKLSLTGCKRPLVVGSGNAAVTGRMLFADKDAVFADESTYKQRLKTTKVDGAFLISASGGKHAPIIAKELKRRRIKTKLLTNNPKALAAKYCSAVKVFPKNVEPYTYNTSTYLGMLLAKTKESPRAILNHIKKLKIRTDFKRYDAFYFIVSDDMILIKDMFLTKFDELFGPKVSVRVYTLEETKHAKTIVHSDKELFVGLGVKNTKFGDHRLNVELPRKADYAGIMATGYYLIGKIQKQHPQYYKNSIEDYTKKISKIFGHTIKPME